ncbi:DUF2726 domain-containing protein [Marinobacterium aestuariivivens]|uniref:DUF2726 domain-containing protein n=1 Tax=Marinobacterium aestuariivivens TaxID=1698799 RepID=A0ABW2A1Z4_9GAMM
MEWFNLPLVIALVLLSILWLLLRRRRRQVVEAPAFRLESALLNDNELNFLHALEQALGDRHRVQCKVGLAAVVGLRPGLESRRWQQAADEICDRQFSFLVCLRDNLKPLCAIELDDSSHRPEPDPVLDRVCNDAGLALLRFPAQRTYVPAEIGLRFDQLFAPAAGWTSPP